MSGYVDFRGNLTTNRSVVLDPSVGGQVVDGHKGSYVVGWDVARKDIRMFLLDAIGEAVIRKTTAAEKAELPQLTARMLERLTNAKVRMVNRPPQPQAA
jgi:predicted DNA-binding transcriptional regulator YafY